jgi:hypothetical protein
VLHYDALLQERLDKALRVALSVEVSSQWLGEHMHLLGISFTRALVVERMLCIHTGLYLGS